MFQKISDFQNGKTWKVIYGIVGTITSIVAAFLTLFVFVTVISRYVFKSDIFGSEEIILLFAWWMYFIGAIGGSMEDSQIKADMIDVFVSNKAIVDACKGVAGILEFVVFTLSGVLAARFVATNFVKMPVTTGLRIPMVCLQIPLVIGFFGMAIFGLYWGLYYASRASYRRKGGIVEADTEEGGEE